jgi:oligosaccharide repeat unit polymerase
MLLALVLAVSLAVEGGDWLAPAPLVSMAFLFSVVCAAMNVEKWNIKLSAQTFLTILMGVVLFCVFSLIAKGRTGTQQRQSVSLGVQEIVISPYIQLLLICLFLVTVIVYRKYLSNSFALLGVSNETWSSAMEEYRYATADTERSYLTSFPTWVTYLYNTMHALAFILLYILINNLFARGNFFRNSLFCVVCAAIYLVSVILRSGRNPILEYAMAALVIWWVVWHRVHGWKRLIHLGYVVMVPVFVALLLLVFSGLREAVGRTDTSDFVSYITKYAGGSIQLFDMYLEDPAPSSGVFGQETFRGIVSAIGRHFNSSLIFSYQLEFRSVNGIVLGNVYTAFRYWIYDFGYVGWTVILLFYSVFYTLCYERVISRNQVGSSDVGLTLYAYIISGIVMLPIQDSFLATQLNPGGIYMILVIIFASGLLIDGIFPWQFRQRGCFPESSHEC